MAAGAVLELQQGWGGTQVASVGKHKHLWSERWQNLLGVPGGCAGHWLHQWQRLLSLSSEQASAKCSHEHCICANNSPCLSSLILVGSVSLSFVGVGGVKLK